MEIFHQRGMITNYTLWGRPRIDICAENRYICMYSQHYEQWFPYNTINSSTASASTERLCKQQLCSGCWWQWQGTGYGLGAVIISFRRAFINVQLTARRCINTVLIFHDQLSRSATNLIFMLNNVHMHRENSNNKTHL